MIIEWFYKNIRVSVSSVQAIVDSADRDKDGYISLGELISSLKELKK